MGIIISDRKLGGIPATIWMKNHALIRQMVQKFGIRPASEGPHAAHLAAFSPPADERVMAASIIRRPPIPGGIRVAHLHLDGEVYILNDKQWKEFSGKVVKELQTRLSRVNAVSFEQAMELSETINSLA